MMWCKSENHMQIINMNYTESWFVQYKEQAGKS